MIDLIKELKTVMEERKISPEGASRYIGCAAKSVYRWIYGEAIPNMIYRDRIREAIEGIKRDFPMEDERYRKGRAHLETLMTFLPKGLEIKDKKAAIEIMGNLTVEELSEIYVSGMDQDKAASLLEKFEIEIVKKK